MKILVGLINFITVVGFAKGGMKFLLNGIQVEFFFFLFLKIILFRI